MSGSDTDDFREYVRRLEAAVESNPDAVLVKDLDGRYQFANEAAAEFLDLAVEDLLGETDAELFGGESARALREQEQAVLDAGTTRTFEETLPVGDEHRLFETTCSPYYDADGDLAGTVSICRDVTDRKDRERALEDQRDELATLDRINEVIREVVRALIGEPTREEIEQAVCDRLVDTDLYRAAWFAEPDPSGSALVETASAGADEEATAVVEAIDPREGSGGPAAVALHDRETQVVQPIRDDPSLPEDVRRDLLDLGYRSGIVVPVRYGDAVYGLLGVRTERASAFSDREAAAFDALGEIIGFAIGAVKHRRLAFSDAVVEIELRTTDRDSFYVALADQFDCRVRLEGMAAGPGGTLLFYDAVSGADPDAVRSFAGEWEAVEDVRLVGEHDDEALFEFTVSGSSLVLTLSEYGANTTEAVTEDGEAHVVARLPADADVRSVVERVRTAFPDVELVAKREKERELQTAREFRRDLDERLTDAQRTALRVSYFAGYYEWPRNSTAEEIAESLGVSSPTFHQHIRKAQRELLRAFFEAGGDIP